MYQHGSPRTSPKALAITKKPSSDSKQAISLLSAMNKINSPHNKKVHWHPDVIENEHKNKQGVKRTASTTQPMLKLSEASSSTPLTRDVARQDSFENDLRLIDQIGGPEGRTVQLAPSRPLGVPKHSTQSTAAKSGPSLPSSAKTTRRHAAPSIPRLDVTSWIMGTQPFSVANATTQRPKRPMAGIPKANSGRKRHPVSKHGGHSVPPAVPDVPAPPREGPPPTPRISRIPTPDLSDVGDENFCTCQPERHGKLYLSKMTEQLNAAKAHINEQAKGKGLKR